MSYFHRILNQIAGERVRQITEEKFSRVHDLDEFHSNGELADMAAYYACTEQPKSDEFNSWSSTLRDLWPTEWALKYAKKFGKDRKRQLIIAGALIVAELERLEKVGE